MIISVVGATASGKTAEAIRLAKELNGEIINCDRFQLYKDLKVLSAYPTKEELGEANHRLFGILNNNENTTPLEWAKLATMEIDEVKQAGHQPIVVGGTGMYLNVLVNGISPLPDVPQSIRDAGAELSKGDFKSMCRIVYEADPDLGILPEQHHQIVRAWEILTVSGKSIRYFFEQPKLKFVNDTWKFVYLNPPREELYNKINRRFDLMLENGAIDEVKELLIKFRGIPHNEIFTKYHIFKTIGAKEIVLYLDGKILYDEMRNTCKQFSRNYAKRQVTWFNKYIKL